MFFSPMVFLNRRGAAAIALTAHPVDAAPGSTSVTFSAQSIGAAAADRRIIVGVVGNSGFGALTGLTIDGNAMTEVASESSNTQFTKLYILAFPTGTTAEFIVTWPTVPPANCGIVVWSVTGLLSSTPVDTDNNTTNNGAMSLSVTAGGIALGISNQNAGFSGSPTCTVTALTEEVDEQIEANNTAQASGSALTPTTTTISPTFNWSATSLIASVCASFR